MTETDVNGVPMPALDALAEGMLLGSALSTSDGLAALRRMPAECFSPGRHRAIYQAITDLADGGAPVGLELVREELVKRGAPHGHGLYLLSLVDHAPLASQISYWADKVTDAADSRRLLQVGQRLIQLSGVDASEDRRRAVRDTLESLTSNPGTGEADRFVTGGAFVPDTPDEVPAVWGRGDEVLWALGEALMLCGPSGVGKTTLAGQLVAGRLGLMPSLLGYPIVPGRRRLLYLAMDRPMQCARALRRLFRPETRDTLEDRLVVWTGPPPHDLAKNTHTLTEMCETAGADTVIVDSLKDAAVGLVDDEVGAGYNRARQRAITAGIQIIELHHQRKAGSSGSAPRSIDDVYGSTWITAGAGSVFALWGSPGDPVVELRHLKQPSQEIGPAQVIHDHRAGTSSVYHATDLLGLVRRARHGATAKAAASAMFDTSTPNASQIEKARRKLESLVKSGHVVRKDSVLGGATGTTPTTYHDASFLDLEDAQ